MEYLKQAVSIPIFLAVIWMVWVFAQVAGSNGVAALLAGMLLTAVAGWVLGRWPAKGLSTVAAVILLAAAIALPCLRREGDACENNDVQAHCAGGGVATLLSAAAGCAESTRQAGVRRFFRGVVPQLPGE